MEYKGPIGEYFSMNSGHGISQWLNDGRDDALTVLWFLENGNELEIDGVKQSLGENSVLTLIPQNQVRISKAGACKVLRFNKDFFCIINHDSEVGCKGLLFYGSRVVPVLRPSSDELEIYQAVWKMMEYELKSSDQLQQEMLQTVLKRWLLLCARTYKRQSKMDQVDHGQVDLVREYNFLVEQHFKDKHAVSDYAELLNKSPKTLSNTFKKLNQDSPLQIIRNRIAIEAKRLLRYTEQNVSEIAYELGFNDLQSFSRFFKKQVNLSPSDFRVEGV